MQINFFAYDSDKWPSWPLAWQSWLLSLAAMLPLGHLYPRICCWKLLSCILNSCKMQNKPMPVSGRRDPTAPWLGELGETSPFPSWPKKPMHCQHNLWGAADLKECWMVSAGCSLHSNKRGSWGQFSFSYKLLQGKLPLQQFSQPWKWVGSPAPSQLCAKIGKNTQLEPHEGKINYLFIFLIFVVNEFKVRYQLDGFSFDSWRH